MQPDFDRAFEIHLFAAVARSADAALSRVPEGERHPLLVYLRQTPGAEHDFATAARIAGGAGWDEVDFTRAATLPPDAGENRTEPFFSCYVDAVRQGFGLMVYGSAVREAPVKS